MKRRLLCQLVLRQSLKVDQTTNPSHSGQDIPFFIRKFMNKKLTCLFSKVHSTQIRVMNKIANKLEYSRMEPCTNLDFLSTGPSSRLKRRLLICRRIFLLRALVANLGYSSDIWNIHVNQQLDHYAGLCRRKPAKLTWVLSRMSAVLMWTYKTAIFGDVWARKYSPQVITLKFECKQFTLTSCK